MKKILSRKKLSSEEADQRIQNLFQQQSMLSDCITYWRNRIGTELQPIDVFILAADKLKTPEDFIARATEQLKMNHWKIYEDYGRFTKVKNKLF